MREKKKFLCLVDFSYVRYFIIFSSVAEFQRRRPEEAALWIKPQEECDQECLPDLLNCAAFKGILKECAMKKLEAIENIAKANFQDIIDSCDGMDVIFACDDSLSRNFRLDLYPQYKANRLLTKRQYQLKPIKDYVLNVLFKQDLALEDRYGWKFVTVDGAEGDDVIATVLTKFKDRYEGMMLVASDHDFLQIDGVREFDLFGKEAVRKLGEEPVSAEDFLLGKILMGDKSDNIKQVFAKCGPKTALKLTKNRDALKSMLSESKDATQRFLLNRKLVAFSEIPKDLSDRISKSVSESLYSEESLNPAADLKTSMVDLMAL